MKTEECKVKYVDELETDFEVKPVEIKINKYKIYGRTETKGYELLSTKRDKEKAIDYASNLNKDIYNSVIVIEHNEETDTDFPIDLER